MTQEEKQLLLVDLCARLPYGVKCEIDDINEPLELESIKFKGDYFIFSNGVYERYITEIKPYLRPMSSITKEEKAYKEFYFKWDDYSDWDYVDWLNAHHFDYRGLIKKGLAIEAPEGMYK